MPSGQPRRWPSSPAGDKALSWWTRDIGPQDRGARTEFARRGDLVSAVALIVGTPLSRMMGNFFLAVSKPMAPTRLFDDEASALTWLREFVG